MSGLKYTLSYLPWWRGERQGYSNADLSLLFTKEYQVDKTILKRMVIIIPFEISTHTLLKAKYVEYPNPESTK